MRTDSFEAATAALWASLGLPGPVPDRPSLRIDGRTLVLSPAPDGRQVVIEAELGRLPPDRTGRGEALRRLMRDGLGLVLTHRACLRLQDDAVMAVAAGPCRADAVPALRDAVEEVLHLLDLHGPTLDGAAPAPSADRFLDHQAVILRL
ncbi:type III secretion system chaperone [Methylobacterium oryzihabitans]|uniref:Uncharacterized protein n=1 Tax=Methylobacterium oryzihabitans TaxID=2499852 RepID=A0A3S2V5P7_9HYPH|nr:type III secretion system chaperone [Methylobacterium oryzihabitans]RVU14212.1 hypothetical protein EOE48_24420 [Methylobacterium oryzihabitans]